MGVSENGQDNAPTIAEIGTLPQGWQVKRIGDVVHEGKRTLDPLGFPDEPFEYYSIPAYQESGQPVIELGGTIHSQKILVTDGTVLFGKLNPRVHKVWRVRPYSLHRKLASTEFIPLLAYENELDSDFLYYVCWSDFVMRVAQGLVSGSTPSRQRVDSSAFLRVEIPLPPPWEQRAIAGVLTTIHRAIDAQDKVIAAARELKKSLMRHLFTYGPVPVGEAARVPLRQTQLGTSPAQWGAQALEQCGIVQTGAAKGRKFIDGRAISVPYLRVANVQDGYLDLSEIKQIQIREAELERYSLQPGDVLLTEGGDLDKLGRGFIWQGQVAPCVHQNHIFAVRVNRNLLSPEYLAYLVQSEYGKRYFLTVAHRTTHLACINSSKLKAFPVLVPTLDEQKDIVNALTAIDSKIQVEQKRGTALQTLFKTALHLLMTGQVRVG